MAYEPQPKDGQNVQAELVSTTGGDAVPASPAAAANGDGVPPLSDEFGRPWVRVVGGGPPPPPFNVRGQLPTLLTAQDAFRQLIASAGMIDVVQLSLEFIAAGFLTSGIGTTALFVQIHDVIGAPPALNIPEMSIPVRQNRVLVSIASGLVVATGAVVVLSTTPDSFTALPAAGAAQGFLSQAVVLT